MQRGSQLNSVQKDKLVEFMHMNEELAKGRFSSNLTAKEMNNMWKKIALELNAIPNGARKDANQWKKTWQDIKKNTKHKKAKLNTIANTSGGIPPTIEEQLTENEEKVLNIITDVAVKGLDVLESTSTYFNDDLISTETEEPVVYYMGTSHLESEEDTKKIKIKGIEHNYANNTRRPAEQVIYTSKEANLSGSSSKKQTMVTDKENIELNRKGKYMDKQSRLQKSLELSTNFADLSKERGEVQKHYYEKKIDIMERDLRNKEEFREGILTKFDMLLEMGNQILERLQ